MALYDSVRALYELAFPGEDALFTDALFAAYFPDNVRVILAGDTPVSMLFSIPYPAVMEGETVEARYLYGVATHPAHRGKGYARQLIQAEAARFPVFLRPMSASLFAFYETAGLVPFSPIAVSKGAALLSDGAEMPQVLTPAAYLAMRDALAPAAYCRMTEAFLAVAATTGGMVACGDACALYDRAGDTILFKEWWGDTAAVPHVAAALGAARYELRVPHSGGVPFGVMRGLSPATVFLAAMD